MEHAWKRWQDWTNLIAGAWLFIAPWALSTAGDPNSSWNAWIIGALIVCTGLWALAAPESQAAEWSTLLLGGWTFLAPWVLGFAAVTAAAWNAWIVGAVIFILAAWVLATMPRTSQDRQRGHGHGHGHVR